MLRGLSRRARARALRMAAAALQRCAGEQPVDVAGLTVGELMRAVQAKRRREVIEHGGAASLRGSRAHPKEHERERAGQRSFASIHRQRPRSSENELVP